MKLQMGIFPLMETGFRNSFIPGDGAMSTFQPQTIHLTGLVNFIVVGGALSQDYETKKVSIYLIHFKLIYA